MKKLPRNSNQAYELGVYAHEFMAQDLNAFDAQVLERVEMFYQDSVACGVSALALRTNAPLVLRAEALASPQSDGVFCYGSRVQVAPEKAILANCAAVREWDANGTVFGYDPTSRTGKGEFGHSDFYAVPIAAAQLKGLAGDAVLKGMLLTDEIRGRLAEVYSLKEKKIDHVVHGAIAAQVAYGAMLGATPEQIEAAIGQFVAHFIPFRAIRHGEQLSDSKGASAAISTEAAIQCLHRAMRGFVGPRDIFRNPQALWCLFEDAPAGESPFDLRLSLGGADFAVMNMHFKIGLYEHQSASALQAVIDLLRTNEGLANDLNAIEKITVTIYQPAFGIICDKAKKNPTTRQSADHSLPFILAACLRKAATTGGSSWRDLMLLPEDYSEAAIRDPATAALMAKIELIHGGDAYDEKYPEGIPTSVSITHQARGVLESGLVMFPAGHAAYNEEGESLRELLACKFDRLAALAVDDPSGLAARCTGLADKSAAEIAELYDFTIKGF